MDHLPLTSGSIILQVPIVATEEYDGEDFFSYPDRKRWDVSTWRRKMPHRRYLQDFNLTNGRSMNETLAFIQTWLGFGLLHSFLAGPLHSGDFKRAHADGRLLWTNGSLEDYLRRWQARVYSLSKDDQAAIFNFNLSVINEALSIADILDWYATHQLKSGDTTFRGLQQQVFLVGQLQDALCSANRKMHRPGLWYGITERSADYGTMSGWLEHQYMQANWCPQTVRGIKLHLDHGAQAYAFALGSVRTDRSHAQCSALRCTANQLQDDGKTKHRTAKCGCGDIAIEISDVVRILAAGQIPVFTIRRGSDLSTPCLEVTPIAHGSKYLAVSHVWADGLANPFSNQLPACQLEYLRHVVDLILKCNVDPELQRNDFEGLENVALWFDGLCIPVHPQHQPLRDFSISKMKEIYANASGVIVLDPDIQRLNSYTKSSEILMRLLLSGWSSRLWTFQEGALGWDAYLVGKGCVFNLRHIRREYTRPRSDDYDDQLSVTLFPALGARLLRDIVLPTYVLERRPEHGYQRFLAAVSGRTTSREGDETVVLASFLGFDVAPILHERDTVQRMVVFMKMLPFIPPSVVFAYGPRLSMKSSSADWGWVPKTLLAPYGVDDLITDGKITLDLTRPNEQSDRPQSFIYPAPQSGLATFFPGIVIFPTTSDVRDPFVLSTASGRFVVHDAAYNHEDTNSGRLRPWTFKIPGLRSALILSNSDPSDMRLTPALLVHYTLASNARTPSADDTSSTDPPSLPHNYFRVFAGRVVRISTDNEEVYTTKHMPSDAVEDIAQNTVQGALLNPTWWLINPFPAEYEHEKKEMLRSATEPEFTEKPDLRLA